MNPRVFLVGACALTAPSLALAQSQTQSEIDQIVVEGTRLDQTATEIGSSVSVITAEDIEVQGVNFVLDAIATAPGVTINQNGTFGGSASVRIRGASSEQTLVLIDGVVVNDPTSPGGGYNFAQLDTESIERIEILKGPQSTLWGTDAIGGVVSIITKRPEPGLGATGFVEYGSFDYTRGGASANGANEMGDFRIAATALGVNGISKADSANGNLEDDAFDSLTLSGRGGLNLPGGARFDATVLWTDGSNEFDSFTGGAQGNVGDGDEIGNLEQVNGNVSLKVPLFSGRLENLFLVGYTDIKRRNIRNGAQSFAADGDRFTLRYQGNATLSEQHSIAFGAEREKSDNRGDTTSINGFFGLYEFKPIEDLTFTGGIRVDDHQRFGSETTGRVAAAYNPTDEITLRASWGQGFKAPSIFQTTFFCCGATEPNSDLQPETSSAFDLGAEWRSADGATQVGITYFNQDTENQIDFSFAVGGYQNISVVDSQGIELFVSQQVFDWLNVAANYAYIDSEDGTGAKLSRVPAHTADVTVSLDPEGPLSGAMLFRYNGPEENTNGTTLDGWLRVDMTARYEVTENIEAYGRVENLFDTNYQQILGYGTPGVSGTMGLRLRY